MLRREPYGKGESHHPSAGGNESKYNVMIWAWIVWHLQAWISSSSKRGLLIACGCMSGGVEVRLVSFTTHSIFYFSPYVHFFYQFYFILWTFAGFETERHQRVLGRLWFDKTYDIIVWLCSCHTSREGFGLGRLHYFLYVLILNWSLFPSAFISLYLWQISPTRSSIWGPDGRVEHRRLGCPHWRRQLRT